MGFQHQGTYRQCGAKTRSGEPCKQPAMQHSKRCRKHGGKSPRGVMSPHFKHGYYSKSIHTQFAWREIKHEWRRLYRAYRESLVWETRPAKGCSLAEWNRFRERVLSVFALPVPDIPPECREALYQGWSNGDLKEELLGVLGYTIHQAR